LRQRTDIGGGTCVLHDAVLTHGPTGDVTRLLEIGPRDGDAHELVADYDDRHRLVSATLRTPPPSTADPWAPPDQDAVAGTITYRYADVGNLVEQRRRTAAGNERRDYELIDGSNGLSRLHRDFGDGSPQDLDYRSDEGGNVIAEGLHRTFAWDAHG